MFEKHLLFWIGWKEAFVKLLNGLKWLWFEYTFKSQSKCHKKNWKTLTSNECWGLKRTLYDLVSVTTSIQFHVLLRGARRTIPPYNYYSTSSNVKLALALHNILAHGRFFLLVHIVPNLNYSYAHQFVLTDDMHNACLTWAYALSWQRARHN